MNAADTIVDKLDEDDMPSKRIVDVNGILMNKDLGACCGVGTGG